MLFNAQIIAAAAVFFSTVAALPEPVEEQWETTLLKRQEPGTPLYECHSNCGNGITLSRGSDPCSDATFLADYAACLACAGPDRYNIWIYYGGTLSRVGATCGLSTTPESGAIATSAAAEETTTAAPVTTSSEVVSTRSEEPTTTSEVATSSIEETTTTSAESSVATSAAITSTSAAASGSASATSSSTASSTSVIASTTGTAGTNGTTTTGPVATFTGAASGTIANIPALGFMGFLGLTWAMI